MGVEEGNGGAVGGFLGCTRPAVCGGAFPGNMDVLAGPEVLIWE